MEKSSSTSIGTVFNEAWEIRKCIGKGSFSEIFLARDITDSDEKFVAIKVQNSDFDSTVIRWESEVLKALINVSTVPKFVHFGTQENVNYLVMDILSGEDMASLRNRVRARSPTGLVALPGAVYLTRQMVRCIRDIHDKGYVHRDVKPANFVRNSCNSTQFSTIDFGIAKLYRERSGQLRPKRDKAEFRGTTLYASVHTHELQDQSPRDDLYSIVFVLLDLICGKLPWTEATRNRDKPQVAALKRQYFDNGESLLQWVADVVTAAEKDQSYPESYQGNFPLTAQKECLTVLNHLKSLEYEDIPDYDLIDGCLQRCFTTQQVPDVSSEEYSYMGFHWSGGLDKLKKTDRFFTGTSSNATAAVLNNNYSSIGSGGNIKTSASFATVEYYTGGSGTGGAGKSIEEMRLHMVCAKINSMLKEHDARQAASGVNDKLSSVSAYGNCVLKDESASSVSGEVNYITTVNNIPSIDISVAIRWKNLVKDLMLLPEHVLTGKVLRLFHRALVVHDGFLNIALPMDENFMSAGSAGAGTPTNRMESLVKAVVPVSAAVQAKNSKDAVVWSNFIDVHQMVGQFYELYDRIAPTFESEPEEAAPQPTLTCDSAAVDHNVEDEDVEDLLAGLRDNKSTSNGHQSEACHGSVEEASLLDKRTVNQSEDNDDAEMNELLQDVKRTRREAE